MRTLATTFVVLMLGSGCGAKPPLAPDPSSDPVPLPPGAGPAPPPPAAPNVTSSRVFGVVMDEEGVPRPDARVVLTHVADNGATQSLTTHPGVDGRYEFRLTVNQPSNVNASIRAFSSAEFRPNDQLVQLAEASEKNFRLRRVRTITVGQSVPISFDADSSRCSGVQTEGICEWVRVQSPSAFTSTLVVRAGDQTGVVPTLAAEVPSPIFTIGGRVVGQGVISLRIGDDESWDLYTPLTIDVAISIPDGMAPQRYEVTATTR